MDVCSLRPFRQTFAELVLPCETADRGTVLLHCTAAGLHCTVMLQSNERKRLLPLLHCILHKERHRPLSARAYENRGLQLEHFDWSTGPRDPSNRTWRRPAFCPASWIHRAVGASRRQSSLFEHTRADAKQNQWPTRSRHAAGRFARRRSTLYVVVAAAAGPLVPISCGRAIVGCGFACFVME